MRDIGRHEAWRAIAVKRVSEHLRDIEMKENEVVKRILGLLEYCRGSYG